MRLGSRDPFGPDQPSDPNQPRPFAGSAGVSPAAKGKARSVSRSKGETLEPKSAGRQGASGAPGSAANAELLGQPGGVGRPPALALVECASIAVGFQVADDVVKKAPIRLLRAQTASPGKFLVLFAGDVAAVEESHRAGVDAAGDMLLDELLLPHAHPAVLPALEGLTAASALDSLAVIETFSFAAAIVAADVAVKTAPVGLIEVRLPVGLGGKSFLTLTGGLDDLQAAVACALDRIRPGGMICRHVLIPNPHDDLRPFVF